MQYLLFPTLLRLKQTGCQLPYAKLGDQLTGLLMTGGGSATEEAAHQTARLACATAALRGAPRRAEGRDDLKSMPWLSKPAQVCWRNA